MTTVKYKTIADAPGRITKGMRTIPCKVCGKPYIDRIDPRVDPANGGYVVCMKCSMGMADGVTHHKAHGMINLVELLDSITGFTLPKYRLQYGYSQKELAKRIGISTRHLRRMEGSTSVPDVKIVRRIEKKLKEAC